MWRRDRLGRSIRHLIEVVTGSGERNIGFRSVTENIDTTTTGGTLTFHIMASLAQFEGTLIRERTPAGLSAARARGRVGGRPSVMTPDKIRVGRQLYDGKTHTLAQIVGVSRTTIHNHLGR